MERKTYTSIGRICPKRKYIVIRQCACIMHFLNCCTMVTSSSSDGTKLRMGHYSAELACVSARKFSCKFSRWSCAVGVNIQYLDNVPQSVKRSGSSFLGNWCVYTLTNLLHIVVCFCCVSAEVCFQEGAKHILILTRWLEGHREIQRY